MNVAAAQSAAPAHVEEMIDKKRRSPKGSYNVKDDPAPSSFSNRSTERKKRD